MSIQKEAAMRYVISETPECFDDADFRADFCRYAERQLARDSLDIQEDGSL